MSKIENEDADMSNSMDITTTALINLARYPLHALDTEAGAELVERCQRDLEERALCLLPSFVRPQALEQMVCEATPLAAVAHYRNEDATFAYDAEPASNWPVGHPRRAAIPSRYRQALNSHIPPDSRIRALYEWPPLTEFVRRVFGAQTMFRSQCPQLSLTLKIAGEGDTDGWHYDPNDGVVSLLLQRPDRGGQFEYAPYIRTPDDERYDDVARLFADPDARAVRPSIEPGTFVLFNGNLSLHRVSEVGATTRPRIIALLSFDREPDQVFSPCYVEHLRSFPTDASVAERDCASTNVR